LGAHGWDNLTDIGVLCEQEKTGQYDFKAGKKERNSLKAGKGSVGPTGSLWLACTVVVLGSLLLAACVYYLATLELEDSEEEVEIKSHVP